MKHSHFVEGFYCRKCGSTTAIIIYNLNMARCIGCLRLYIRGNDWEETSHQHAWQPTHTAPSET